MLSFFCKYSQCPGKALADSHLFIVMANLLKFFEIKLPNGMTASDMANVKYTSGLVRSDESHIIHY